MAEKINKNERKNKSEIITEMMGSESEEFWKMLGTDGPVKPVVKYNKQKLFIIYNFEKYEAYSRLNNVYYYRHM